MASRTSWREWPTYRGHPRNVQASLGRVLPGDRRRPGPGPVPRPSCLYAHPLWTWCLWYRLGTRVTLMRGRRGAVPRTHRLQPPAARRSSYRYADRTSAYPRSWTWTANRWRPSTTGTGRVGGAGDVAGGDRMMPRRSLGLLLLAIPGGCAQVREPTPWTDTSTVESEPPTGSTGVRPERILLVR